ncbi:MAG: hypothetical protein HC802_22500 [Caldilineaceae bacterium]|nr:hypothetical protein [Caldilineaceae bacterium]
MALALDVPGHGWKAATLDAQRWPFLLLAPTAPLGCLLMRSPPAYRALWPVGQAALGVHEALVDGQMREWHDYQISWDTASVCFAVDGQTILACQLSLAGPLGFVCWLDNQYMVVTPQGRFRHGLVASDQSQWMEVASVSIRPGVYELPGQAP